MSKTSKKFKSMREDDSASDADVFEDEIHNRFLENIKQSEGKPKITPATRKEPAAEVSEFNLQSKKKSDKGKSIFRKEDLLRPLKSKNAKLAQKLEAVKKTSALPKPLETVFEKKIQREVGYEKTKKQLDRWQDVVQNNRVAEQLRFPLKDRKIEIYDHTEDFLFCSSSNPTPLEKELSAILNSSDVAKEDHEKMEQTKFRTSLKDILSKRKMMASVRAKASYVVSKAQRQNKIKSKKYHRLLRGERTKQQIKDFEALQKTDPEAALKQLEMLEKSRAEERATLRHRNTGKWARNQLIKAKYNKESRVALSEQLSKNRQLTQDSKIKDSDDSAEESDDPTSVAPVQVDSDNPWVPGADDYDQFISSYKKYYAETEPLENSVEQNSSKLPEKSTDKENFSEPSEKIDCAQNITQETKNSPKSKKPKKKSVVEETVEDDLENSDKCVLIKEITNSSGCWTVSKLPAVESPSNIKSKKNKKKSSESGPKSSVSDLFESLEEKISKKLKRKINEIEVTKTNAAENKKVDKKEKSKKRKKQAKSGKDLPSNNETNKSASSKITKEPCIANDIIADFKKAPKGVTDLQNDDEDEDTYRQMVEEAFAADDVVADFEEEKAQAVDDSLPKIVDSSLPGWGSWTSTAELTEKKVKTKRPRFNKRLLFKVPKAPPRKDANKGHVVINEEKSSKLKEHLVSALPYPFTRVKDFEASIRAPIGRNWVPETAHRRLIAPPVVTKLGAVIEPMDEGELMDQGEL